MNITINLSCYHCDYVAITSYYNIIISITMIIIL